MRRIGRTRTRHQAKVKWEDESKTKRFTVDEDHVAEVIAMMTGIPAKLMSYMRSIMQMNFSLISCLSDRCLRQVLLRVAIRFRCR